jgi:hypothetical protein
MTCRTIVLVLLYALCQVWFDSRSLVQRPRHDDHRIVHVVIGRDCA